MWACKHTGMSLCVDRHMAAICCISVSDTLPASHGPFARRFGHYDDIFRGWLLRKLPYTMRIRSSTTVRACMRYSITAVSTALRCTYSSNIQFSIRNSSSLVHAYNIGLLVWRVLVRLGGLFPHLLAVEFNMARAFKSFLQP